MNALLDLLGKPIEECKALLITTASYPLQNGPELAWKFISGNSDLRMTDLGWKSIGVLELTAIAGLDQSIWLPQLEAADVLLVNGGDSIYLNKWMRASKLNEILPSLDIVYVGLSSGSMVMTPKVGEEFMTWTKAPTTDMLGFVDFAICPHLAHGNLKGNALEACEAWARKIEIPAYIIDDETAIKVVDDQIEIISEGIWYLRNKK